MFETPDKTRSTSFCYDIDYVNAEYSHNVTFQTS